MLGHTWRIASELDPHTAAVQAATADRCPLDQVGGQAVINGVMLRGPEAWAVAVRDPAGVIQLRREALPPASRWSRVPVVRGVVALVASLRLGLTALQWSASVAAGQKVNIGLPGVIAAVISLPLFVVGPALVADVVAGDSRVALAGTHVALEVALLLGYLAAVARNEQVRGFFRFHGAEHKVVNLFERHGPRTLEAAAAESTRHPRCGTSFLLIVAVVAAAVSGVIGHLPGHLLVPVRLVALPLVVGLAFEAIKLVGARADRWWAGPVIGPGLALQGLTTREPSADDLAVALVALEAVAPELEWTLTADAARGPLAAPKGGGGAPRALAS